MTKHRRVTGFVAVALLAIAATTANMRSHSSWTQADLTVEANKPANFEDRWSAMFADNGHGSARPMTGCCQ